MNAACVRHTELPGTSKLFADFLYHYDRVAAFYPSSPAGPVDFPADRRAAIVEALSEINRGSKLLDQLAQPGGLQAIDLSVVEDLHDALAAQQRFAVERGRALRRHRCRLRWL